MALAEVTATLVLIVTAVDGLTLLLLWMCCLLKLGLRCSLDAWEP